MEQTKYEIQELRGNLHVSKVKSKDTSPDRFGKCKINGKTYSIAGWLNTSKSGNEYLSLKFEDENLPSENDTENSSDNNEKTPF